MEGSEVRKGTANAVEWLKSNSQRQDVPPDEVCRDLVSEEAVGGRQPPKN